MENYDLSFLITKDMLIKYLSKKDEIFRLINVIVYPFTKYIKAFSFIISNETREVHMYENNPEKWIVGIYETYYKKESLKIDITNLEKTIRIFIDSLLSEGEDKFLIPINMTFTFELNDDKRKELIRFYIEFSKTIKEDDNYKLLIYYLSFGLLITSKTTIEYKLESSLCDSLLNSYKRELITDNGTCELRQ